MQQVIVNVDDPDDILAAYGPGALVRLERDATAAFGSPTEIDTTPVVSGQSQYDFFDNAGTSASYYRSRYSGSAGAPFSEYSDAFQPGAATAYATLDAIREELPTADDSQDNLLVDLLEAASRYIDAQCGRDFLRHPALTGTEVRQFDGSDTAHLFVRAGIVSLDMVELAAAGTGTSYTPLAAGDWYLDPPDLTPGESYHWVRLSDAGTYSRWAGGRRTVQLTGVFGSETVPALVSKATIDLAREWHRQGVGGGGPVGVNQFGTPLFMSGMPGSVRDVIALYRPVRGVH